MTIVAAALAGVSERVDELIREAGRDLQNELDAVLTPLREQIRQQQAVILDQREKLERFEGHVKDKNKQIDELTARLTKANKFKGEWKATHKMYQRAWIRELGGKIFNKAHLIDALVKTTAFVQERSERLDVVLRELGDANQRLRTLEDEPRLTSQDWIRIYNERDWNA